MADLKLYYFPTSFYSQKVLMALFEKEATFREQMVFLILGEQNEPWYVRITPKGTIPAMEVPGRILTDSTDIVNYVDKELDTGIKLIPNPETKIGQDVDKWRNLFDAINVPVVTYGILFHTDLSNTGLKIPFFLQGKMKSAKENMQKGAKALQEKADKYPELREQFLAKLSHQKERIALMTNREAVVQALDELDVLFKKIEDRLAETQEEQGVTDSWLVGARFTMADINLAILLDRLTMLGLEERYFSPSNRPLIHDFYVRMGKRKSVQQVRQKFRSLMRIMVGRTLKKSLPVVVGVLGVALGVFCWRGRVK